jgi:hypothetical protein
MTPVQLESPAKTNDALKRSAIAISKELTRLVMRVPPVKDICFLRVLNPEACSISIAYVSVKERFMDTPEIWAHHASEEIQPQWRSSTQESAGTMVGVLPNLIDGLPEGHLLASGLGNFE